MVEGTPLLRVHLGKTWIQGSNPCVSASESTETRIACGFAGFSFQRIRSLSASHPALRVSGPSCGKAPNLTPAHGQGILPSPIMNAHPQSPKMKPANSGAVISAQSPLIFMHLPKTGGMSLFTAFSALWRTAIADLYNVSSRNPQIAVQATQNPGTILYCGHYAFGLHGWLDRPAYYASVLREPVSRIVSLYHFIQPNLARYKTLLQQAGGDIEKLRADKRLSDYYFDFLPCLRGEFSAENFLASPSAELDNGMVRRFSGYGINPAPCPEAALEQAKLNIERHFSVVGLLERYPETLELMSRTFGLPALNENHVNQNRSKERKPPLDDAVMQRIRDMNRLDTALYDWVSARFDAQREAPRAIPVPGGGRTGAAGMPLWLGVGESPIRKAAMQQGGVPEMKYKPILCGRLANMSVKSGLIHANVDTVMKAAGEPARPGERVCLVIKPELAKTLIKALQKAVEVCEKP